VIRLWLLIQGPDGRDSKLLDGPALTRHNVHPLRCIYLGKFKSDDDPTAMEQAQEFAVKIDPVNVAARNIRLACDGRQTKRWRLSEQEMDLLLSGKILQIRDSLGTFAVKYSKLEPT